jgi:ankyrin repeat protein
MRMEKEALNKMLRDAAYDGDLSALGEALGKGADVDSAGVSFGTAALIMAAGMGRLDCLARLIDEGCDVERVDRFTKMTAREWAIKNGHEDCAGYLFAVCESKAIEGAAGQGVDRGAAEAIRV